MARRNDFESKDPIRTRYGIVEKVLQENFLVHSMDPSRTLDGLPTDPPWTLDGPPTDGGDFGPSVREDTL